MCPSVFMESLRKLYRVCNLISLDIAAGAVASAMFFGKLFHVHILPYGLMALALTVWIIYTADHLRDAANIKHSASSARHQFHQRHFNTLIILMGCAIVLDIIIIFFIRKKVLEAGVMLAIGVMIYLVIQRYLKVFKEFFVACLYTCGVLLPSFSVTSQALSLFHAILIVQFAIIALLNLLIFSWFDHDNDLADQQSSFATILGKGVASRCIIIIGAINFLGTILAFMESDGSFVPAALLGLMNVFLVAIFLFSTRLQTGSKYRVLGDGVFFIPSIYLWIP
jgi:hypothetical protein